MDKLYQYAWLVPVLPLFGATIVGIGLISFNQATNKLRQGNSIFIVSLLGVSMVLSFALFWSQFQGHGATRLAQSYTP
jgi:NAD(P)H-quinone oxidoreductase subunit 5